MFSIIMPVYNHAAYIDEAIRSVRDQTFEDWELIVVDDGSTDGSADIARRHAEADARITVLRQANAGAPAARNAAARRARADWLAFLDSDDLWYADALETYARKIAELPDAQFIYGYRDRLNADGSVTRLTGQFQEAPTGPKELFGRMFISVIVACLSKSLFQRAGGFDEGLRGCEDYELFLRLGLDVRFYPIGRSVALRRRHESNVSARSGFSRFLEAEVLRRFVERQGGDGLIQPELAATRLARIYRSSGWEYLRRRHARQGIVALRRSLSCRWTVKAAVLKVICGLLLPFDRDDGRDLPWLAGRPG